ncbi:MAG: hypothetical protein ACKOWL_05530 [Sphingobacteriaceae bacterium]
MKKNLFFLVLFLPLIITAQTDSLQTVIDNYLVNGKAITYVKVYDLPGLNQSQVKELIIKGMNFNPLLSISQTTISENQIVGSFSNLTIDFRKYGFRWGEMAVWVGQPASASFALQFKEGKYRLILKDVKLYIFDFNSDFVDKAGKLSGTDNPRMRKSYYSFGKTMNDLFDFAKQSENKDW